MANGGERVLKWIAILNQYPVQFSFFIFLIIHIIGFSSHLHQSIQPLNTGIHAYGRLDRSGGLESQHSVGLRYDGRPRHRENSES